ncbi:MAG: adenosylcobinamide-GDP ribazoletransferase, partial [Gammaproteobacteria bacterium]|nr:adenosylcobinamide-GDP ribazoletransferase [Gammaproteobacteria bacterium]
VAGLFRTLGPPATILALAGLVAGHVLMRLCFERKLGGYTGDTLGAVQQASEVGLYLGVCAGAGAWA